MLSAFHTKFKALKSRLPQSSLDSPWRMALFWLVATVVILASSLLIVLWEVFKAIISGYQPRNDEPRNDVVAVEAARAAEIEETEIVNQHYEINEFGTIQGLKDSKW